jgi:hypothetical protein
MSKNRALTDLRLTRSDQPENHVVEISGGIQDGYENALTTLSLVKLTQLRLERFPDGEDRVARESLVDDHSSNTRSWQARRGCA